MSDAQLLQEPATKLAQMVRSGEVGPRELTELALDRIGTLDSEIGAFMHVDGERALADADAIVSGDQRPFAGVPTAIKDIVLMLAGAPYTSGSDMFGDFTPDFDSAATTRIKNAGFVIVGKTKTPEMGILPVTESRRFGPVGNPWDLSRTPGGSSGGSAAAVAAGMLPIAHGNDGGGSLRIPGACCGLLGFKMSRGRVSYAPMLGDSFLNIEGMLSRSVLDVATACDVLTGYEPGDASWAPPPTATFAQAAGRDPGSLKIAVAVNPPLDTPVDPLHLRAVEDMAALLESLGHDVQQVVIPWDSTHVIELFKDLWAVQIASLTNFGAQVTGREVTEDLVEPLTWEFYQRARGVSGIELASIDVTLKAWARGFVSAIYQYDAILSPALAQRPVPIGHIDSELGMAAFDRAIEFTPFTAVSNLTGQPAVSVPAGIAEDGLPLAIQLIGRPIGDEILFALAGQVERAQPWARDLPAIAGS